jgi:uncharacterized protein (DUF952 family)
MKEISSIQLRLSTKQWTGLQATKGLIHMALLQHNDTFWHCSTLAQMVIRGANVVFYHQPALTAERHFYRMRTNVHGTAYLATMMALS